MKGDRSAKHVDDIVAAARNLPDLIENLDLVFKRIQEADLRLSMESANSVNIRRKFKAKTISTAGTAPIKDFITKFLKNLNLPISAKTL